MPITRQTREADLENPVENNPHNQQLTMENLLQLLQNLQTVNNQSGGNTRFEIFNKELETFTSYKERLENFFDLKKVPPEEKAKVLINSIGAENYQMLSNAISPDLPKTKPYEMLINKLEEMLCPEKNEISEQHRFGMLRQTSEQSITDFVAELKKVAMSCNFKCNLCQGTTLNTHLRFQFIIGLKDSDIRERLLLEKNISFENAVKMAGAIEASKKNSRFIQGTVNDMEPVYQQTIKSRNYNVEVGKLMNTNHKIICYKCGTVGHKSKMCKAKNLYCSKCKKSGHIAKVCKSSMNVHSVDASHVEYIATDENEIKEFEIYNFFSNGKSDKIFIEFRVDNQPVDFEFDTGSAITTMNEKLFREKFPNKKIQQSRIQIRVYNKEILPVIGETTVKVSFKDVIKYLPIYIVPSGLDSICGRNWINSFRMLDHSIVNSLEVKEDNIMTMTEIITKDYNSVFEDKIGTIPEMKVKYKLREDSNPIYFKPRIIPFAIKKLVEEEISRLEKEGIFEKVNDSDWGTPVVPILKSPTQIRLCADYKITLNQCIVNDKYPIPKIENLYQRLRGGKYFCVLDIHKAYLHMEMSEESSLMQTVSTHLGLYKVNKMMFGVKNAPNIWQRFMDTKVVKENPGVACFFDDIIISGSTLQETESRLRIILQRLKDLNLHCGEKKCKFFQTSVSYLGHTIDVNGLHKTPEKIEAILKINAPKDCEELRRFLGMVNYYNNFIPDLASKLHHLNNLLRKDVPYVWSDDCEKAFQNIKEDLVKDSVLMVYDENLPLILATDASPYGLSAILSHITPEGERPIAYASRSLTKSEANYSHIDKEGTAIFWALHKFFDYCYGREFTLITDNKPLTSIFNPDKKLPLLTAQRLLHYAQFLSGFKYKIQYRKAADHINVDCLSREPMETTRWHSQEILQLSDIILPITSKEIAAKTKTDEELQAVYDALLLGKNINMGNFKGKENQLMLQNECIYFGERVIIPKIFQKQILEELHLGHIGIVRMKWLARSYCYWYNIDRDIENIAKQCRGCAMVAKEPNKAPIHPWEEPTEPWQRIHCDFAGPFLNKMFFVVVDSKTKWLEVVIMNTITTAATIRALREIFARFGFPNILVSDNGTSFTSTEFQNFLKLNGIIHKRIAPGHPATNGQAERFVQTVKNGLKAAMESCSDIHLNLQNLLVQYRKTTCSEKEISPAQQILNFNLRSRLDLIKHNDSAKVVKNDAQQMPVIRSFVEGDLVQFRNYQGNQKWKFGTIKSRLGRYHYLIIHRNQVVKRHINQFRSTGVRDEPNA